MPDWVRVLLGLMLAPLVMAPAAAQLAAEPDPPLVVAADAPVRVWISGLEVALAVSTGTVDHVTLNDESVRRIGLSASAPDNTADLVIGGRKVLKGRHGKGWLGLDGPAGSGALVRREFYWFPGEDRLPLAGTIGPFALPYWRVRVEWPAATGADAEVVQLPLVGGINNAAYGALKQDGLSLLVGADVRTRRALPLVTAATGADLAARLGGKFVGEAWAEEILLGVARPLRRLELARPLMIGPIRIDGVAVRQGGPRDATMSLERGQITPLDAEEDPEVMAVRGRILKQRRVARYIMLSRTQLEAAGCTSLTVDKAELLFALRCAPPPVLAAVRPPVVPATSAVPVAAPAGRLIEPLLPELAEAAMAVDAPLAMTIDGRPRQLVLGDAGADGVRLNGDVGEAMLQVRLVRMSMAQALRGQLGDALRAAGPGGTLDPLALALLDGDELALAGVTRSQVNSNTLLSNFEVALAGPRLGAQAMAFWISHLGARGVRPDNSLPFDGRIALAAVPETRLRLALGARAEPATTAFSLPIGDRSHDQGVMGVAAVPGIDALFVGLEFGSEVELPVVSMALGEDLIRLHGGRNDGPVLRRRAGDYRLRLLQPMRLATPLVVGPLRLERVLVEQVRGLPYWLRHGLEWVPRQVWPDIAGIGGLERELRVPVPVLQAAGCQELVVDKPGRVWTLRCAPSAAPAPSDRQ